MKNEAYNKHYQTLTLRDSERNAPSERLRMAACVCEHGWALCMCACVKPGIERFKLATAREIACIFRLCIQLDRICMCSYETVSRLYMCVCETVSLSQPFNNHIIQKCEQRELCTRLQSNVNMRCSRRTNSLLKICSNEFPLQFYSIYSLSSPLFLFLSNCELTVPGIFFLAQPRSSAGRLVNACCHSSEHIFSHASSLSLCSVAFGLFHTCV